YTATSGAEAAKIVSEKSPGLIIMDINLGEEKDGIDYFKEFSKETDVRVIFMTGYNEKNIIEKAKTVNPEGFILKPYKNEQLKLTVEMCINKVNIESKLLERDQDLHLIFNNIHEVIIICDAKNKIIDFNEAANQELGYSNEELMKMHSIDLIDKTQQPKFQQIIREIYDSGKAIFDLPLLTKSGKLNDFEIQLTLNNFKGKEIKLFVGRNMSFRKKIEAKNLELIHHLKQHQEVLSKQNEELLISYSAIELQKLQMNDLFDNAPVGYIVMNQSGIIQKANHTAGELLNVHHDRIVSKQFEKLIVLYQRKDFNKHFKMALLERQKSQSEFELRTTRAGQRVWIKAIFQPDSTNETSGVRCAFYDISHAKTLSDHIAKNEERLAAFFVNTPAMLYSINQSGEITDVSAYWLHYLGFDRAEVLGKKTSHFSTGKSMDSFDKHLNYQLISEGIVRDLPVKIMKKNGEIIDVLISANSIYDENGALERSFAVMTDITQELKVQNTLMNSELKFRSLTENSSDIILTIDKNQKILFVTTAIEKLLGYDHENIIGKNFMEIISHDDHEDLAEGIEKLIEDKSQVYQIDLGMKTSQNETRKFECKISNMLDNEAVGGIVVTAHEITARLKIQSEINHMVTELEMKNLYLNMLNDELNEANATKDKFFSIIAHDLKSPFNTMVGFADLLVEDYMDFNDAERYDMIKKIYNASMNALKLLENLLEWSRVQRGKMEYHPEKIDLYSLCQQVLEQLEQAAVSKQINIQSNIRKNTFAHIDKYMIATVVRNLVSNAIKFTNKGGFINIGFQIQDTIFLVSIADSGTGMSQEQLKNLFHIESNVSTSGTEGEAGTGLGLILCKDFIDLHNCNIWAESTHTGPEDQRGSTFYFTLPAWISE
ncbi:MAG: PAS domain S-box protein, partial [Bacteroidales bacterium]|nr:PAS domain S-box protein [Bacteroidales bacterium]